MFTAKGLTDRQSGQMSRQTVAVISTVGYLPSIWTRVETYTHYGPQQ